MNLLRPLTPAAEVDITPLLIRSMLEEQHPDLVALNIQIQESGWDNVIVRLGDKLALRLPRRQQADSFILKEHKLVPEIARSISIPVPVPIRTGRPTDNYPFNWSILEWLPGRAADLSPLNADEMPRLISTLKTLHGLDVPENLPGNPMRSCALYIRIQSVENWLQYLRDNTNYITPAILKSLEIGCAAKVDVQKCLIMGDFHARNVLVKAGKLSAIIDWGDMCLGDPAVDLICIWALFDEAEVRRAALSLYGASESTIARAKGWAIFFGIILAATGMEDTPRHAVMGRDMLRRIDQDS